MSALHNLRTLWAQIDRGSRECYGKSTRWIGVHERERLIKAADAAARRRAEQINRRSKP